MKQLIKKINLPTNSKKLKTTHLIINCLAILLIIMLMGTTLFILETGNTINALPTTDEYDEIYYVSADGNDAYDGLSEEYPFATLAKTANIINSKGVGKNYLIYVISDLTSTACARYFDNNITITSSENMLFTVTRGANFAILNEPNRGQYNPAMIEIGGDVSPSGVKSSLTLKNIIFDDAYLHEGTTFNHQTKGLGDSWATVNLVFVQDAIVASYSPNSEIILGYGAQLCNFGGMTALRAADGATVIMQSGSLITEVSTASTRQLSATATDYRAVGESAVTIAYGAHFYMYEGAKIENIANAHSVKFDQGGFSFKCFIDGEITGMKGNRGWDATDRSSNPQHEGRSFKSAVFFTGGTTLDPNDGAVGSAIIGPNANIHHNAVKCGAIGINRSTGISVKIYGKINDNVGQTGTRWQSTILGTIPISYGTNGGGLYIVAGGIAYLEEGSELCRNSVINYAYGGGANVQQGGSKLVMNGGLVLENTAAGLGPGIAINKGGSVFEMNGGVIDNGANGVLLFNNQITILGQTQLDSDCNSYLDLKAGTISGVTVHSNVAFGNNNTNQYRHLRLSEEVNIGTGYVSIAGRNVYPTSADFKIGNPNTATYTTISANLPEGWTIPTNANVIGFWIQKDGIAHFSVPAPTTSPTGGYNRTLGVYFAAVQATTTTGAADTSSSLKLYPTTIIKIGTVDHIVISAPLGECPNGATVALVQPTTEYGIINFEGPETLLYDLTAEDYTINYIASYNMPQGLYADLLIDGHSNANTDFIFTIRPDSRTIPDSQSLTLESELFEITGNPSWNPANNEFVVTLNLKVGWDSATDFESQFSFDCIMDAVDFEEGEYLKLTGELLIAGQGKTYLVYGDEAKTEMVVLKGELYISKTLSGDAADETQKFHFTVTFSDGGTYSGITSGSTITLKGGEHKLITGIPRGIAFTVVEEEANQDGYVTTFTGASGTISEVQAKAAFTNTRNSPSEHVVTVIGSFAGEASGAGTYTTYDIVTVNAGSNKDYIFTGWTTDTGTVVFEDNTNTITTFVMPNNDVTIIANWIAVEYNIHYVLNGGVNAQNNPITYTAIDLPLNIASPTRTSYTFLGWTVRYENGSSITVPPTNPYTIPEGTTGDITLTALWIASDVEDTIKYTITYHGNGHTSGTAPIDANSPYVSGSIVIILGQGTLIKEGYTFLGWTTNNSNNPTITHTPGTTFTILSDTVLYAVWTEGTQQQYTITYQPGTYGTFKEQITSNLNYGDPTPQPPVVTGVTGWKFTGWNPVPTETVQGDAVYVAQWEQDVFTVTFKDWDGTILKTQEVVYGGSATAPANPSRSGYTFTGWDRSFTNVISDIIVTAQYTQTGTGGSGGGSSTTPKPPTTTTPPPSTTTPPPNTTPPPTSIDKESLQMWALVNLILSIAGIIIAIIMIVYVLIQQRNRQEKQETQEQKRVKNQYMADYDDVENEETLKKQKKIRLAGLITTIVLAIAGIIVFLLTEDMNNPMTLIDKWTIINAILFIAEIITIALTFKNKKTHNNNNDNNQSTSNSTTTTIPS